jgi:glycine cleavage system H protein
VSGEVTAINDRLVQKPEAVNSDPHGSWMIALKVSGNADDAELLNAEQYGELTR